MPFSHSKILENGGFSLEKGVSCHPRGIEVTIFSYSNSEITTFFWGGGGGGGNSIQYKYSNEISSIFQLVVI